MLNLIYFLTIFLIIGTVYFSIHGRIFFKDYHFYATNSLLISASDAKKLLTYNRIDNIIDVRTPEEFAKGHYKNAINIPIEKINYIVQYIPDKKESLLIYSSPDERALYATERLILLEYLNIRYINEPYSDLI